jgi:hypothetical protein
LKRRLLATIEWLRLYPKAGPLPQEKHTLGIGGESLVAGARGPGKMGGQDGQRIAGLAGAGANACQGSGGES